MDSGHGTWLAANSDAARGFVQAAQRGYALAAENPAEAADILIAATEGMLANPDLYLDSLEPGSVQAKLKALAAKEGDGN